MTKNAIIAANRFGLGARPGDLAQMGNDAEGWLVEQLTDVDTPRGLPASSDVIVEVNELRMQRRAARADDDDLVQQYTRKIRRHYVEQVTARYRHAAATERPFTERLVHFWSNHFAVSADKQPIPAIAGLFENEAIRPNVLGNFTELLTAAAQHPAMILYLDNQRSIGPDSKLGKRARRFRPDQALGLNENLAREILELHTLGVAGGYTQEDVTAFARVITGWSIGGANPQGRFAEGEPGKFEFRDNIHEPGTQRILGKKYAQGGVRQGEAVLYDLARHPSTATFIARKLVRHFVADEPSAGLVERLAAVYRENDTELRPVYRALIESDEAFGEQTSKYKTPHDFVISAFRAFDHVPSDGRFVAGALDAMGQTAYRPGSPEGWPDTAAAWGGPDALYKRIEWSSAVANYAGSRIDPIELGQAALGSSLSTRTVQSIKRAESVMQGTTLLLASPEFQRR
ncbi:MAG: DUF1800 domain-containing protein [Pseudomonadota bacterium]